jgi:hypothetical protein
VANERQRRIGLNEAVFREVNERLRGLNEAFSMITDDLEIVCECGAEGCFERLLISADAYEALRADSTLFAVAPGHEAPDVEDVVEQREGYDVVRKRPGPARELAEATDPRP